MKRTLEQYANTSPRAVADGSPAQMFYFVQDAKADIAELAATLAEQRRANERLGQWMRIALDDADTCETMKADIRTWLRVTA
jgi:hypothetical protein